jgi:glutaredoxin 3
MSKPIEIYGTAYCPYCVAAKNFLAMRKLAYTEVRIDQYPQEYARMLERSKGRRSVPQIFIGEHHVGGYDDLVKLAQKGGLDPLLKDDE